MRLIASALLLAATIPAALYSAPAAHTPAYVAKAVADPARPGVQTKTDPIRKPADTLTFAGVKPGMAVGEFYPGGGYFTQMLSDIVGAGGHVYALENARWQGEEMKRLLANPKYANVSFEAAPFGAVSFPKPLDLVWVTQNYHDLKIAEYGQVDTAAFDRAVFAALKPGGTFFVLDHEAPPGTTLEAIAKLHRIEKAQVIREVTAAGFTLAAEGKFLHRPGDDHTLSIFDKKIQGKTDQYALRFVKPKG